MEAIKPAYLGENTRDYLLTEFQDMMQRMPYRFHTLGRTAYLIEFNKLRYKVELDTMYNNIVLFRIAEGCEPSLEHALIMKKHEAASLGLSYREMAEAHGITTIPVEGLYVDVFTVPLIDKIQARLRQFAAERSNQNKRELDQIFQ